MVFIEVVTGEEGSAGKKLELPEKPPVAPAPVSEKIVSVMDSTNTSNLTEDETGDTPTVILREPMTIIDEWVVVDEVAPPPPSVIGAFKSVFIDSTPLLTGKCDQIKSLGRPGLKGKNECGNLRLSDQRPIGV